MWTTSLVAWFRKNKLLALAIAVACWFALGHVIDGFPLSLTNLVAQRYRALFASAEKQAQENQAKLDAALKELAVAKKALSVAKAKPPAPRKPPAGDAEMLARFKAKGFEGRVIR